VADEAARDARRGDEGNVAPAKTSSFAPPLSVVSVIVVPFGETRKTSS
jgi:hypothetical protein